MYLIWRHDPEKVKVDAQEAAATIRTRNNKSNIFSGATLALGLTLAGINVANHGPFGNFDTELANTAKAVGLAAAGEKVLAKNKIKKTEEDFRSKYTARDGTSVIQISIKEDGKSRYTYQEDKEATRTHGWLSLALSPTIAPAAYFGLSSVLLSDRYLRWGENGQYELANKVGYGLMVVAGLESIGINIYDSLATESAVRRIENMTHELTNPKDPLNFEFFEVGNPQAN